MKNVCSIPVAPAGVPSLHVQTIWDVNEGPSYDVRRNDPRSDRLIAVRTRKGAGRVYLTNGKVLDLAAGTVVVLPNREIARYHCAATRWVFWGIEFTRSGVRQFPLGTILAAPGWSREAREFRALFVLLRRQSGAQRALAVAKFAGLLYRWMEHAVGETPLSHHEEVVTRIVDRMMERIETGWPVRDMARAAGMSERAFRNAFHEVTGVSPKHFYEQTRLSLAEELLKLGTHNVSEIAVRLGYSSPFHFSKAFKHKFGVSPVRLLQVRRPETLETTTAK